MGRLWLALALAPDRAATLAQPTHCGSPLVLLLVILTPIALVVGGFVVLIAAVGVERHRREAASIEAFPLASVDYLARALKLRSVAILATLGATAGVLVAYAELFIPALLAASLLVFSLARWWEAHRATQIAACPGATAEVRRDQVTITCDGVHVRLYATPRLVARAKAHGLPRATA